MQARGESIRKAELTDFQTINLDSESVRPDIKCPALVMILRQGKTNKNNRLELTGCIRNTQVQICPIIILGMYLFWRFHVQNEPFPDFTTSENWYRIKLFKSSNADTTEPWTYSSHRDAVSRGLEGAQVFTKKETHINRGSAARMAGLAGVNEDQIRRLGRWNITTLNGGYLTGLPREVMRVMAGFTVQQGKFYLPRPSVDPPESLCKMIFADLDAWNDRLTAKQANPSNGDEMGVTVAAKAFFELMFMLRKTIIQDAVFMIENFPVTLFDKTVYSLTIYLPITKNKFGKRWRKDRGVFIGDGFDHGQQTKHVLDIVKRFFLEQTSRFEQNNF